MRAPTIPLLLRWIKKAWEEAVTPEIVRKSFLKCGISNAMDGTEDHYLFMEDDDTTEPEFEGRNFNMPRLASKKCNSVHNHDRRERKQNWFIFVGFSPEDVLEQEEFNLNMACQFPGGLVLDMSDDEETELDEMDEYYCPDSPGR